MTIRAALLDATGVYLRMDELAEVSQITESHLSQIIECDLPAGKYRWIADSTNSFGGAFWPLAWIARIEADRFAVQEAAERAAERERIRALPAELRRAARAAARAERAAKVGNLG
jgi:hypothetical protein